MIRGVIFDLGMTLIQFTGDWDAVLEESWQSLADYLIDKGYHLDKERFVNAFRELFESRFYERTVDHIEQPTTMLFDQVMTQFGHPDLPQEVIEKAIEHFYSISEAHWTPKKGVKTVLDGLKENGLQLALISNAGDVSNVHRLLDKGKLDGYFHPILVSAAEGIRKPHGGLYKKVLRAWKLPPEQIIMIGDSLMEDILGAQWAGMHQIWLKEHVDTQENLDMVDRIQPEAIAASFEEIPQIIHEIYGRGRL